MTPPEPISNSKTMLSRQKLILLDATAVANRQLVAAQQSMKEWKPPNP
jgi:hypothetical protein